MIDFSQSYLRILFIQAFLVLLVLGSNSCGKGCSLCSQDSIDNSQYNCSKCSNDYLLDSSKNVCVYTKCSPNLYFQVSESQNNDSAGECLSICNPLYKGDATQNLCNKLIECSFSMSTQNNIQNSPIFQDFIIYQEKYYIVLQQRLLSIYEKKLVYLIKHLYYLDEDLNVISLNGVIFVLKKDNSIAIWDIVNEQRTEIYRSNQLSFNQQTQLLHLFNQYVLLQYKLDQSIILSVLYDLINKETSKPNTLQISTNEGKVLTVSDLVVVDNMNYISISQIKILNSEQMQIQQGDWIKCDTQQLGDLQGLISTTVMGTYFSIHTNGVMLISANEKKCQLLLQQNNIQKVRLIEKGATQINFYFVILTQQFLIGYEIDSKQTIIIKNNVNNSIIDFELGNFLSNNNQLILLDSQMKIEVFDLLSNQFQILAESEFIVNASKSLKKLLIKQINQVVAESKQSYETILISNNDLQIVRQGSNNLLQLESKLIQNYNMPYPTPNTQVNSLVLIYSPSILVTCHQNGDIVFYDTSSGIDIFLIKRLEFNQQCIRLERLKNNKIVAQLSQSLLLINPYLQNVENQVSIIGNDIQITANNQHIAINYNNCIQILSSELASLFQQCDSTFSSSNVKIELNHDLKIVTQKLQSISIYQIDLLTQSIDLLFTIASANSIIYFQAIKQFDQEENTINNSFLIDEIVYYDTQRTFKIYDFSLQLVHQVLNVPLISINQAKRVINDKNVYFLIGLNTAASPIVKIHAVSKKKDITYIIDSFQSPILDDPVKIVNEFGAEFYHVKHILQLNFFSLYKEYMMDINRNVTYICGHDYIYESALTTQVKKKIGSSNNFIIYSGTTSGLVGSLRYQEKRYKVLSTQNIFLSTDPTDKIKEIIQSASLGMYFVRTSSKITAFNIFTNDFIEELSPQLQSDPRFLFISKISSIEGAICWGNNQILLSIYGDSNTKVYFRGMTIINGWVYDSNNNFFYVYGSKLVKLDTQLKIITTISDNTNFIECKETATTLICSNSLTQFSIIEKQTDQIIYSRQVRGFTKQYKIGLDEEQNNLFLYDVSVQVFTLLGIQKQIIDLNFNTLNTFGVHSTQIVFFSKSNGIFINRSTLTLNPGILSPSGLDILKYIFIDVIQQIILYCNNSLFAQIYIYNTPTQSLAGKISGAFALNQVGQVVSMDYDMSSTYIQYLDDQGNYYVYGLFGVNALYNNFKITEVVDRKESLVGFTYNNKLNNVLVYSSTAIYQINYSIVGHKFQFGLNESEKLFAKIPIDKDSTEFLLIQKNNNVFRYSNFQLIYEDTLKESQVKDIQYDSSNDILIIGFVDQIHFYQQYQQSRNNNIIPLKLKVDQVPFYQFLQLNIYLTYDKKILHYNTKTGQIINSIQLDQSVMVTKFQANSNHDILLIGLSNGQLLQYNLKDQSIKYYSITNTNDLNTSVVCIIIDEEDIADQMAFFVTNGAIVIQLNLTNKQLIQEINLIELVNAESYIQLVDFLFDKTFSRFIFFFSGEKKVYVWNFQTSQQEKYLILTNDQGNKLKLKKRIKLVSTIQRNNFYDLIIDYQVINENIIIIFLSNRYEVFLLSGNNNILIVQNSYKYSRFLGYIFNEQTNFIKIYGLHQQCVFEHNYSLNIYNNNKITKCASLIESTDPIKYKQLIQSIVPKQTEILSLNGRSVINKEDWKNIIYLKVQGDQFSSISQFISQSSFQNTEIILSPQSQQYNQLTITTNTLKSFSQPIFQLNNYDLEFQNLSGSQNTINLSENVEKLIWESINIKNQLIDNIEIKITNIKQIIINSLKIQNISDKNNKNTDLKTNFFTISDTEEVQLYELEISDSTFQQQSQRTIFAFNNVKSILINRLKITNNIDISSIFKFSLVGMIKISNIEISNNLQNSQTKLRNLQVEVSDNIQNNSIFRFQGCDQIYISDIIIKNNQQLSILQSQGEYTQNNKLIILIDDLIIIENATVFSNKNSIQPLFLLKSSFVTIKNMVYNQNQGSFISDSSISVLVQNSKFTQNIALNGGAIYFRSIKEKVEFQQSLFSSNIADSSGGAFFFENIGDCSIIFDQETQVINNKALIGGGIRLVQTDSIELIIPSNFPFEDNVKQNFGELYGDDSTTYLQSLIVQNLNDPFKQTTYQFSFDITQKSIPTEYQQNYSSYVRINSFQSGSSLKLRIFVVDNYKRRLSFSKEKLINGKYPSQIQLEIKSIQILIENLNTKESQLLGEKILNYNQYDSISQSYILRDLQIQATLQTHQYFSLNSNIYTYSQTRLPILVEIQIRECILGEIIQEINEQIQICKYCSEGSYSLQNPQTLYQNSKLQQQHIIKNECIVCPYSANSCQGSKIELKNGYWRKDNFSDEILECNSKIGSCQAQQSNSLQGCSEGYIGALCEECDTIGDVWKDTHKRYSQSVQIGFCQECANTFLQLLYFILKIFFIAIYFFSTLKVFIDQFIFTSRCFYLRAIQLLPISKNSIQDYSGFYIKIIINYLQLSSLLIQQPKFLNLGFNFLIDIVGSSNRQLSLGIDCILNENIIRKIGKVVVSAFIQFLIPIIFIAILIVILQIIKQTTKMQIRKHHYTTFLQIHFTFFQLEQISYFTKALTCKHIGSESYYPYDLTKICDDPEIRNFIYPFSIIILIIWTFLPIILLNLLKKNKNKLNECRTRYSFGFFYGELKSEYYFWEFVRMYIKIIIIYIHILLFQNFQFTSTVAIILILAIYVKTISQIKPFISKSLTKSEVLAYSILILKIFFSIIEQDESSTQIVIEALLVFLDYAFFCYLCTIIIIFKANNRQSISGKIFRNILIRILPKDLYQKVTNLQNVSFKTYINWKFIRMNLQNIIHLKANQNINTIITKQNETPIMKSTSYKQDCKYFQLLIQKQQLIIFILQTAFKKLIGNSNQLSLSNSPRFDSLNSKKQSKFQLFQVKPSIIEISKQNEYDQVLETAHQQQTEEYDPKKIESYCFSPKTSILSSQFYQSKVMDTNYYENIFK